MNRPPKNSNKQETLLEDSRHDKEDLAQDSAQPQSAPADAPGDDRNLVGVDEVFKEADFEEKMWLLWNNNKAAIVGGSLAVLIAVVGSQFFRWYQEDTLHAMQASYAAAEDSEAKLAFAAEYSDQSLSGVALLAIADEKYAADAFTEAAELYTRATDALQGHFVQGRALIGQGIAWIRAGDVDAGKLALATVADGEDYLQSHKAEAIYHLASIAVQDKDYDSAKLLMSQMETLDHGGMWASQLNMMKQNRPELSSDE